MVTRVWGLQLQKKDTRPLTTARYTGARTAREEAAASTAGRPSLRGHRRRVCHMLAVRVSTEKSKLHDTQVTKFVQPGNRNGAGTGTHNRGWRQDTRLEVHLHRRRQRRGHQPKQPTNPRDPHHHALPSLSQGLRGRSGVCPCCPPLCAAHQKNSHTARTASLFTLLQKTRVRRRVEGSLRCPYHSLLLWGGWLAARVLSPAAMWRGIRNSWPPRCMVPRDERIGGLSLRGRTERLFGTAIGNPRILCVSTATK